ncbi:hypothetical protein DSECCO2_628540 [anaerobic digester metagenome]
MVPAQDPVRRRVTFLEDKPPIRLEAVEVEPGRGRLEERPDPLLRGAQVRLARLQLVEALPQLFLRGREVLVGSAEFVLCPPPLGDVAEDDLHAAEPAVPNDGNPGSLQDDRLPVAPSALDRDRRAGPARLHVGLRGADRGEGPDVDHAGVERVAHHVVG